MKFESTRDCSLNEKEEITEQAAVAIYSCYSSLIYIGDRRRDEATLLAEIADVSLLSAYPFQQPHTTQLPLINTNLVTHIHT